MQKNILQKQRSRSKDNDLNDSDDYHTPLSFQNFEKNLNFFFRLDGQFRGRSIQKKEFFLYRLAKYLKHDVEFCIYETFRPRT